MRRSSRLRHLSPRASPSSSVFLESLLFSGGRLRQLRKATRHVLKRFSEGASRKREPAPLSAANNADTRHWFVFGDTRHPSPGRSFSSSLLLPGWFLFPLLTSPPFLRPDSSRVSVVLFPVCHPSSSSSSSSTHPVYAPLNVFFFSSQPFPSPHFFSSDSSRCLSSATIPSLF